MPRATICCWTICWRSAAKSEACVAFWPQPLAATAARTSHCQTRRIRQNSAHCLSFRAKTASPARTEEFLNTMSEERKTLEQRAAITDVDRRRHSPSHVLAFCHVERSRDISHHFP